MLRWWGFAKVLPRPTELAVLVLFGQIAMLTAETVLTSPFRSPGPWC
jgi:hypothetical protein